MSGISAQQSVCGFKFFEILVKFILYQMLTLFPPNRFESLRILLVLSIFCCITKIAEGVADVE